MIRPISVDDAPELARLHRLYMPDSTLATFGLRFLQSLYRGLARSRTGIGFVSPSQGTVQAYIAAATDSRQLFRDILKFEWFSLFSQLLLRMRDPRITLKAVRETLQYSSATEIPGVRAEYLFIAIAPELRRRGTARTFILKVREEMKRRGVEKAKVSILDHNPAIKTILLDLGFFKLLRSFELWGKKFDLLVGSL